MPANCEMCPLLRRSQQIAKNYGISGKSVRCPLWESGECPGSTNEDECRLIQNSLKVIYDVRRVEIYSQPPRPFKPLESFIQRLQESQSLNPKGHE